MTKNLKSSSSSNPLSLDVGDCRHQDATGLSLASDINDHTKVNNTITASTDTAIATLEDQSTNVVTKPQQNINGVLRVDDADMHSTINDSSTCSAALLSNDDYDDLMEHIPGPPRLLQSESAPVPHRLRKTKSYSVTFALAQEPSRDTEDDNTVKGTDNTNAANSYIKSPRRHRRIKSQSFPGILSTARISTPPINKTNNNDRDSEDNNSSHTSHTSLSKQSTTLPSRHGRLKVVGVSPTIMQAGVDHSVHSASSLGTSVLHGKSRTYGLFSVAMATVVSNHKSIKTLNNKGYPDTTGSNDSNEDYRDRASPPIDIHHEGDKRLPDADENVQVYEANELFSFFAPVQSNGGGDDSNHYPSHNSHTNHNYDVYFDQEQQSMQQQASTTRFRRSKPTIESSSHHSYQSSKLSHNMSTREGSLSSTPSYSYESMIHKQNNDGNLRQYRLQQTFKKVPFTVRMIRLFGFGSIDRMNEYNVGSATGSDDSCLCFGRCSPNQLIIRYLHWTFRQSFTTFIIVSSLGFWALTVAFAVFIMVVFTWNPQCLGGSAFNHSNAFSDSYQLSWTTFATVGYGIIYPSLSPFVDDIRQCTGVTVLVTLEAFVGMLYASFCSAILFIKVSRIQSVAQVAFSDPIVVRYGTGLLLPNDDDSHDSSTEGLDGGEIYRLPCPILEFRIANRMHNAINGEIINCSINIVASIDAKQTSHIAKSSKNRITRQTNERDNMEIVDEPLPQITPTLSLFVRKLQKSVEMKRDEGMIGDDTQTDMNETHSAKEDIDIQQQTTVSSSLLYQGNSPLTRLPRSFFKRNNNDGNSEGTSVSSSADTEISTRGIKRVFTKLKVESSDHPFFNRVWTIRHRLNEDSPLLKQATRELIKKNNGYLPVELNHYDGVKNSFHFDSFLVSFSGTSNADCSSCYAQHIYDFDDVNVGYTFRNMICHDRKRPSNKMNADGEIDDEENCRLGFDMNLLDSIIEQAGGGGEPIFDPLRARYLYELQLMKNNRNATRWTSTKKYANCSHSVVSDSSKRSFSPHPKRGKFASLVNGTDSVKQMVIL